MGGNQVTRQCSAAANNGRGHRVTANVLKGLLELPKTYWTRPIGAPYLNNATVTDSLMVDYARITGGLPSTSPTVAVHAGRRAPLKVNRATDSTTFVEAAAYCVVNQHAANAACENCQSGFGSRAHLTRTRLAF